MSDSTITQIGDALESVVSTISGLRVHRHPPESVFEKPCALIYSRSGSFNPSTGDGSINFHKFHIDLIGDRQVLPEVAMEMEPYLTLVQNALWGSRNLNGTVDHIGTSEPITYELVTYPYATELVFAYRIIVPVKHKRTITP